MKRGKLIEILRSVFVSLVISVQVIFPTAAYAEDSEVSTTETAPQSQQVTEEPAASPATSATSTEEQPAPTVAATPVTTSSSNVAPTTPTTASVGPQKPTGAESKTYVYNQQTGLWENEHYTWDPVTKQTKPKTAQQYSYNPDTGKWDTTQWYYSPESGKYVANVISSDTNPSLRSAAPLAANMGISSTGNGSNNTINSGGSTTGTFDLFFDATISNKIGQLSQSGNATVQGNTLGGNAVTGDALALTNVINMLQSSWGKMLNGNIDLFVANIDGDVTGDLYIDPAQVAKQTGTKDIDVNISSDAAIYNDIDVAVASGDALVNGNTTGGSAKSGDAKAVVNLLNLINSAINSNNSFIGVLNINGNLDGDILLPPNLMQAIIAATGPNSNNQINNSTNNSLDVSVNDNKTIDNNIVASASSGDANVIKNTSAGNATTGSANNNVVLLNLTGQRVVAKNAMLVFVNVLGSWVGLIFDAPAGTNAVATTGPGSSNTINSNAITNADIDITKNSLIKNDVNVTAQSGDATVSENTNAGDATTGDAEVGVNVANLIDSQFDISDWFGVLFINVFGSWQGSFGVNTAAGNKPNPTPAKAALGILGTVQPTTQASRKLPQTFSFVSHQPNGNSSAAALTSQNAIPQVAGDNVIPAAMLQPQENVLQSNSTHRNNSALWVSGISIIFAATLLGGERLIALLRGRQLL